VDGTGVIPASPAVWAGNTLYLSALSGFQPADGTLASGLDAQVHQLGRNHLSILEAAGLTLEDIVAGFVYLRTMEDYQGMNAIYREYFSRGAGVRTTLMPNTGMGNNDDHVQASFIAARTAAAAR
jgi:2-iminobutanoate/2-iminopropanoate deaminase